MRLRFIAESAELRREVAGERGATCIGRVRKS